MKDNVNQKQEEITVIIQGEKECFMASFEKSELDKLVNSREERSELGGLLGRILDGNYPDKLTSTAQEKGEITGVLLSKYVAKLMSYQMMLATGAKTLVLTSFRVKDEIIDGYVTRVAGIIGDDIRDVECLVDGTPTRLHPLRIAILDCLSDTSNYKKKIVSNSVFYDLKKQAKEFAGRIQFKRRVNPSLN